MNQLSSNISAPVLKWIADASYPEERLTSAFRCKPTQNEVVLNQRREYWQSVLEKTELGLDGFLEYRNTTKQQWLDSMQDVEVDDIKQLPLWAKLFLKLYQHWLENESFYDSRITSDSVGKSSPQDALYMVWSELNRPW